jgi:predicted AAA+ superfamily ATPase
MNRFYQDAILRDLEKKMVFLCGPRQVGKTWLAKKIAESFQHSVYLNYDRMEDRDILHREAWLEKTDLLILDEIHKMPDWKNFVKGIFDTRPPHLRMLITGSSRLEMFRQVGDSLAGRFFRHRLMPLSISELLKTGESSSTDVERLITRSGFPEPFLAENPVDSDRWRLQYIDGLIRTDILDFEKIHDFRAIQLVLELLRRRVGSPISYVSIAEDASISPNTVKKYIEIFEALYVVFKVAPHSRNIARSLVKEPKIYFYDTGMVAGDDGVKFENFVALSLLKHVYALNDYKGQPAELRYIRTKDGDEIDFCIAIDDIPESLIEVKMQYRDIPSALSRFHKRHSIPAYLLVRDLKREQMLDNISIVKAETLLGELVL